MQDGKMREEGFCYSGKVVKKGEGGGGGGSGERGRRGKKGENVGKRMNQTSSGDKSRTEPNGFRQLHLERQIRL